MAEFDLPSYYARFNNRAMPEGALIALSRACTHLPPGHIGYKVWMACVAGPGRFYDDLAQWSIGLGEAIARCKPKLRFRARTYVPSYKPEWGRVAALDGLHLVIHGTAPKVTPRAEELGCDREAYMRIRNFVAGALYLAMQQYETELRVVVAVERVA